MTNKTCSVPIVVLAGGFGTRLKSEISDLPKALAPVNGRPFLSFLLDKWIRDGFRDFYFSLFYRSDDIIAFLDKYAQNRPEELKFNCVTESEPMGTGGATLECLNKSEIKTNFLVVNADTWLSASLQPIACHEGNMLGVVKMRNSSRYGLVEIDEERVVGFREKEFSKKSVFINSGVYKFTRGALANFPVIPCSLERDLLPDLIRSGRVGWLEICGDFIDIGVPKDYRRFVRTYGN